MKRSEAKWFGTLPERWQISTIGALYAVRNEKVSDREYPPLSVTMKGVVPQLETAAKTDAHDDRKLVKKGDFAINSRSDRRGSCGISEYDGSVSLINTILTPRVKMNPHYYNLLFHTAEFADEFYKWGHGIVDDLWTTRWQEMKNICLPIPDLAEQETIYAFLSEKVAQIDALIANQEKQIEKLKQYKQVLITEVVTKGLDPTVPMKDSGVEWIGEIPEKWTVNKVIRLFDCIGSGTTPKGEQYYKDGTLHFIQSGDINGGLISNTKNKVTQFAIDENSALTLYKAPFLIIAMYGGSIGHLSISTIDACVNQACCVMQNPSCNSYYAFYCLNSAKEHLIRHALGGGQPNISQSLLKSLWLPFPPLSEQNKIVGFLNKKCIQIENLVANIERKIEKLNQYKKSLIYEYVTGKKEVQLFA